MNQRVRSILFSIAYLLVLVGAILYLTQWEFAPYLFAMGAAGVTVSFLTLPTKEMELRERRLHRFHVIAGILMVCASGFMFKHRTEWILCLTISAIFQLYASFVSTSKSKKK